MSFAAGTNMTPIALTGWNLDVIVEAGVNGPPYTNYASEIGVGSNQAEYSTGLSNHVWGLPPSGAFTSLVGDGTLFQFQPYTAKNALVLSSDTGLAAGTLTLVTPATYGCLAILAQSANGTSVTGPLTLNFQDGSTFTTTYNAPDWFNNNMYIAYFGHGRINLVTDADDGGTQNPRLYQTTVNLNALLGATNKPLASLTFGKTVSGASAIFAVSGLLATNVPPVAKPIAATGWNRDLVIESSASGPPYSSAAAEFNPGENKAFYQTGLAGTSRGFPQNGSFVSAVDGAIFQFQPYTANNALVMSTGTGVNHGTLTLTAPAAYNSLEVVADSGGGGGSPPFTINFSDGTSLTTNLVASDWFNNTPNIALLGFDRINLTTGAADGGPTNPRFYQTIVDLVSLYGATNKVISSIAFNQATNAGATAIYAISGVQSGQTGTYSLATISNAPAANVQSRSASVGGGVISTGGAVPEVFVYYGTSDGGTNAAQWSQRVFLGYQTGGFTNVLTALAVNTTYYYRAVAINAAGIAWAPSSLSFATPSSVAATVTNYPAASVRPNSALLSGSILSTGGDAPAVTIFYGTSNGGTTPGAWANSVVLAGPQNAAFGRAVGGLTPNTTYYYSAQAVNAAGASWGTPVQSFTTPAATASPSAVAVLTGRNDNGRTGLNSNETVLTPANVNSNTFGKLFSYPLDGCMIAQPLVLTNVSIPGAGVHNVLVAATEHDSVYAFDADTGSGSNGVPLWRTSFINPSAGITPLQCTIDLHASSSPGFYGPEVGIAGTPVIDPLTGTIYAVAKTKEISGNVTNFVHRLHALDVATGAEKFGGPVLIEGSIPGYGDGFYGAGTVPFDQFKHMNRPALLLVNGNVCVTFTSHQDYPPYHGWVFNYDAYTLQFKGIFNTTPNSSGGGIWQSSSGPAADAAGNIYFETGNGGFDGVNGDYGDAVVKVSTASGGLSFADYFAPYNQLALNLADQDVGSAGLILLPDSAGSVAHPHLMVAGSKPGVFWLLDRENMGQFNPVANVNTVQEISGSTKGMWVTPGYFNGTLYYCASGDNLKAFAISNATVRTPPTSISGTAISFPGFSPSISANGTNNGIVWGIDSTANQGGPAVLHAYNAANVAQELYNSSQNLARDNPGLAIKFTMPTVANGKVYVGAVRQLSVFGNLSPLPAPVISPNGATFTNSVLVSITSPTNGANIYYTLDGSTPTTNSILYSSAFSLTNSVAVSAVLAQPGVPNGPVATASFYNVASFGNGTGLTGQYYANTTYDSNPFTGTPLTRVDPTINFNWNSVSPDPSIPTSLYTVRWTGMVQPLFNESYTFYTTTDDGARLWVNGQLLVDAWSPQSPTTWSGSINLKAMQLYSIEMDYFQNTGGAIAQLSWSSPSTASGIIPQTQLYPFTNALPLLLTTSAAQLQGGALALQLSGMPGHLCVLQTSTNLVNWTPISTNFPSTTIINLSDPNAANFPARFYRVLQLP